MEYEKNYDNTSSQIIQSLSIGGSLSKMEQLSALSFINQGHEYHLYTYGDVKGIPDGVVVKDASEILDRSEIFTYRNGSYSAFSNYFRFSLLERRGGYWADTDLICVRNLKDFDHMPVVIITEPDHNYKVQTPTSCLIKLPKGSEMAREGVRIQRMHKVLIQKGRLRWSSGPATVKQLVEKYKLQPYVLGWRTVCSCNWADAKSIVEPYGRYHSSVTTRLSRLPVDSYCIHLWNEVWRRNGLDKNHTYDYDSLYEELKRINLK